MFLVDLQTLEEQLCDDVDVNLEGKIKHFHSSVSSDLVELGHESMEHIQLAQGRVQWCASLNMVVNFLVPEELGMF